MDSLSNKKNVLFNKARKIWLNFYWYFKRWLLKLNKNESLKNQQYQLELDKKLVFSLSKKRLPSFRQLRHIKKYYTDRDLLIVRLCLAVILVSSIFLGARFYITHLETVPAVGGEYIEGVVGTPKYINPLYANVSDVDDDLSSLIYSSLFKRNESGQLTEDLASHYEISPDNKSYIIKTRNDVKFHDGSTLTVDDVLFTFNAIKDAQYKSPLRASFVGVEIERIDDNTVKFILTEPYAAFLDLLTFGILPSKLWQHITPAAASLAELNLKPIGTGPYKFKSLIKDKLGNLKSYNLVSFEDYFNGQANVGQLTFKPFVNYTEMVSALNNNLIDGVSYLPDEYKKEVVAQDSLNLHRLNHPQLTAIFFNLKSESPVKELGIRQALSYSLDKIKIVEELMGEDGNVIDGPILPDSFAYSPDIKKYNYDIETAGKLLDEAGWKIVAISEEEIIKAEEDLNSEDEKIRLSAENKIAIGLGNWRIKDSQYLIMELTTVETSEYIKLAEKIAEAWEAVSIRTQIKLVPVGKIQNEVIRQRKYSILLYSEIVGFDPDPYAFWHSSQAEQGGLNIANYTNKEVDQLLEDARLTGDIEVRKEKYKKFQETIANDLPAIFIYNPIYIYAQSKKIKGFNITNISLPRDRFSDVKDWYIETGKKLVW